MRRILTVALLAVGGTLAMSGVAAADIGDVQEVEVNDPLFGTASQVDVTGTIDCQATIEYGLWVGVAQDDNPSAPNETFVQHNSNPAEEQSEPIEGVGAYGPEFNPPVGVSDDSPCSQSVQSYDVVVTQNRDSGDFEEDQDMEVLMIAATSAVNGTRGPGPFVGDVLGLQDAVDFDRTR